MTTKILLRPEAPVDCHQVPCACDGECQGGLSFAEQVAAENLAYAAMVEAEMEAELDAAMSDAEGEGQ